MNITKDGVELSPQEWTQYCKTVLKMAEDALKSSEDILKRLEIQTKVLNMTNRFTKNRTGSTNSENKPCKIVQFNLKN